MGLLSLGAPDDEYEVEIDYIKRLFMERLHKTKIAKEMESIFWQEFNKDFHFEKCLSVTEDIWNELFK